jgi:peptidoglycan/LPS O-acetylase OafA/YrhL
MNKRFEALDAFRGLAALSVVIFHMHLVGSLTELAFFRGSAVFVQLFFVLSGFVLTHGYGFKQNLNFSIFMKSRFFRLYPLHLFMFIVFILLEFGKLGAYKYGGFTFNELPFTGGTAISEIIPNLLLIQSWVPFADPLSFNFPSWSISIEFYLYALLFLSVVTFSKFKKYIWIITPAIAFYLLISGSEIVGNEVLKGLSCFFGGAVTYLFYRKIADIKPTKLLASVVEVAVIIGVIIVVQSTFKYQNIVTPLLFYIVIIVFSFESGIISHCLKLRPFQVLGKLSYSIYMTHAAILFCLTSAMLILQKITGFELAPMINGMPYLTSGNEIINNVIVFLILTIVILISNFTYKHIEIKWQKRGRPTALRELTTA